MQCFLDRKNFFFQKFGDFLFVWGYFFGCYFASEEVYFLYSELALGHADHKATFSEKLENSLDIFDQLLMSVVSYANIINILCTLVRFDDCIEVLTDEARKDRRGRLSRCANLRYANNLLEKLTARKSIE